MRESFLSTFAADGGWALLTAWPNADPRPPNRFLAAAPAACAASLAAFISSWAAWSDWGSTPFALILIKLKNASAIDD